MSNYNCFPYTRMHRSPSLINNLPLLFLFNFSRTAEALRTADALPFTEALLLDRFSLTMILVDVAMEEKSRVLLRVFI